MVLSVQRLSAQQIRSHVELSELAFWESGSPSMQVIYPGGPTAECIDLITREALRDFYQSSDTFFVGCFDSDASNEMIAAARWRVQDSATFDEKEELLPLPGVNTEAGKEFIEKQELARKELMGRREHFHLQELATAKKHEGRGAARALLKWGIEFAEQRRLPMVVISTGLARPIYPKYGWKEMSEISFDWTRFGETRTDHNYVMLRS